VGFVAVAQHLNGRATQTIRPIAQLDSDDACVRRQVLIVIAHYVGTLSIECV
jgi:hypothetical protein